MMNDEMIDKLGCRMFDAARNVLVEHGNIIFDGEELINGDDYHSFHLALVGNITGNLLDMMFLIVAEHNVSKKELRKLICSSFTVFAEMMEFSRKKCLEKYCNESI